MTNTTSIAEKLSSALAPTLRKLRDININATGMSTSVLRINPGILDKWGQSTTDELDKYVIANVVIKHPFSNKAQLFSQINNTEQQQDTTAIDLMEFLPIEVYFKFQGDYDEEAIELKRGDLLVYMLRDEHNVKIPVILQITRIFGAFSTRYIVSKNAECTLWRGTLQDDARAMIELYINSLT